MIRQEDIELFIRSHHLDHTEWCDVCRYYVLSEDIMREYADEIEWFWICKCQKLSEDFMREFGEKLWIMEVFKYQKITPRFADWLITFEDQLDDYRLSCIANRLTYTNIVYDKDLKKFRWKD